MSAGFCGRAGRAARVGQRETPTGLSVATPGVEAALGRSGKIRVEADYCRVVQHGAGQAEGLDRGVLQ